MIPFGEWLPDRPDLENPGTIIALNVVPTAGGFAPFQGPNTVTNALTARCQGANTFRQVDDESFSFAGDINTLYGLDGATWADIGGQVFTVGTFEQWRFTQFGTLILAVNGGDKIQKIRAGTDAAFSEITASPISRYIAAVRDFVVVGPVTISDEINVQWSERNNVDGWTSGVNSSGAQPLFEGGPLQGLTGGEFGTILQESTITRMTFVGGDLVFTFDVIENARGCRVPGSIVQFGPNTYYWSEEGVEVFTGTVGVNIGEGKVNHTILRGLDFNNLHLVTATIDPERRLVIWAYPTNGDTVDRMLIYNVGQDQFSDIELNTQVILSSRSIAISIDDITGSIDASPLTGFPGVFSLDSPELAGILRKLAAFNTSNIMATLDGDALAATLTLGEFMFSQGGKKTHTRRVRGNVDDTHTVSVLHRKTQQASKTTTGPLTLQADGSVAPKVNDRYQSLQVNMAAAGTWNFAQGIDIEEVTKGGR